MNLNAHTAVFELLDDEREPTTRIATRLAHLTEYYEKGRTHYQENISIEDPFDYDEAIAFLGSLQDLSRKMSDLSKESKVILTLSRDKQKLNVMPISQLLEQWSIDDCLSIIQTIQSALVVYLHSDNCVEFKTAFRTLSHWRSFFLELQTSDI